MGTYTGRDKRLKYLFANGGGGGSVVSITPTLSSGIKIADYSINGVGGELYAPSGGGGSVPFIDVSNHIYTSGNISSNLSSYSYTATQDCYFRGGIKGNGSASALIYLNGETMLANVLNGIIYFSPFLLKAGDKITLRDLSNVYYTVDIYGIRS